MVVVPTVSYTSLRDIVPHDPNNASWNQIPIKNPLLKQAALAYLQPMSTPPEIGNKTFLDHLKENCFCGPQLFGCFRWLNAGFFNALLAAFVGFFCERRRIQENEDRQHQQIQDDDVVD
ncbi:hypothetical protein SESBI_04364 [Sesbania bispinosa]|nr:hypothetical protein SESBI_04364 [Sesbania bispinosa]